MADSQVEANRKLLMDAQENGGVLKAFIKLSGPGWLQSAITLGGGSLAGSLFLGVLGGTNLLWLQLLAIAFGVIMLSAISFVTLSTGKKPFQAINEHINPVLGWGWLIATIMANVIWCMPQFSLCFAALQKNLVGSERVEDSIANKMTVSIVILLLTLGVVILNRKQGLGAKIFDLLLKGLVAIIVLCFFGVIIYLTYSGQLSWGSILTGFIPDLSQAFNPTGEVATLISGLPDANAQEFWSSRVVKEQRAVMIGAAATAVGINMTFLLPYSMLNRGWDKPFRGLARFDLATGMAIPYVLVTSCVVIASASSFHGQPAPLLESNEPSEIATSPLFKGAIAMLSARTGDSVSSKDYGKMSEADQAAVLARIAELSVDERRIAASLVKRDAFQLSKSLAPLLGPDNANLVFGLGIFGMGFSTIIILMLINGYAFCEMLGKDQGSWPFLVGVILAGGAGATWPYVWDGDAKLWLAILASSFGAMLLPIAYVAFFMMMNNKKLMGEEKPKGTSMVVWNILMALSVAGAIAAATTAIIDKANDPKAGTVVLTIAVGYLIAVAIGFAIKLPKKNDVTST